MKPMAISPSPEPWCGGLVFSVPAFRSPGPGSILGSGASPQCGVRGHRSRCEYYTKILSKIPGPAAEIKMLNRHVKNHLKEEKYI